jgi:hypothetical protein
MNESEFSVASRVRIAMVALAVLAALVAVQAFSAKPAEAGGGLISGGAYGGMKTVGLGGATVQPPNDNFLSAQSYMTYMGAISGAYIGDTTRASLEAGEPRPYSAIKDCGIYGIDKSVWFKLRSSVDTQLKVSTEGSSFDTVLGLYKGSSLTSLQQVGCSNDNNSNWTDTMTVGVAAEQTYYLQLSGTGGLRSGAYRLSVGPS